MPIIFDQIMRLHVRPTYYAKPRVLARTAVIERTTNLRDEASPSPRDTGGRKMDTIFQQQWRDFAERFIASVEFDDPAQPPPRVGGLRRA